VARPTDESSAKELHQAPQYESEAHDQGTDEQDAFSMLVSPASSRPRATPLADRYARWYEQHPRGKAPAMESAPTDVTRTRGPVAQPTGVET